MTTYVETGRVELYVFGLASLLPQPVTAVADVNSTWVEFLNEQCNLTLTLEDDIMIYNTSFSGASGRGWYANLNDPIRLFLDKFKSKNKTNKYSLRLGKRLSTGHQGSFDVVAKVGNELYRRTRRVPRTKRAKGGRRAKKPVPPRKRRRRYETYVAPLVHHSEEEELEECFGDELVTPENGQRLQMEDEVEHLVTLPLPVSTIPSGLGPIRHRSIIMPSRRSAPPDNNIVPIIKERSRAFSSSFMLKMEKEMQILQGKHMWQRNVQHSPLCCFFLQEVFQK